MRADLGFPSDCEVLAAISKGAAFRNAAIFMNRHTAGALERVSGLIQGPILNSDRELRLPDGCLA